MTSREAVVRRPLLQGPGTGCNRVGGEPRGREGPQRRGGLVQTVWRGIHSHHPLHFGGIPALQQGGQEDEEGEKSREKMRPTQKRPG